MTTNIVAVRGAATLDDDEAATMTEGIGSLMEELEKANLFRPQDIISIQFTQTADLGKKNAAAALREAAPAYSNVPLFCAQEPNVEGMMPKTVRILVTFRGTSPGKPVYLGDAAALRPDLFSTG